MQGGSKWNLGLVIVDKLMLGETQERVNTWCTVLCFAKQWKVRELFLHYIMRTEGWEALSKVADKENVDFVRVSKSALSTG